MNKKVSEIAKENGVSRQSVYRAVEATGVQSVNSTGTTKVYDLEAQKLIIKHLGSVRKMSEDKKGQTETDKNRTSGMDKEHDSELIIELRKANELLTKELENRREELAKSFTLLDQQQQLSLDLQKQLADQKLLLESTSEELEKYTTSRWWQFWK